MERVLEYARVTDGSARFAFKVPTGYSGVVVYMSSN